MNREIIRFIIVLGTSFLLIWVVANLNWHGSAREALVYLGLLFGGFVAGHCRLWLITDMEEEIERLRKIK